MKAVVSSERTNHQRTSPVYPEESVVTGFAHTTSQLVTFSLCRLKLSKGLGAAGEIILRGDVSSWVEICGVLLAHVHVLTE